MKVEAVLFDLDDTLYVEAEFFRSGFAAIARTLAAQGLGEADSLAAQIYEIHWNEDRERVLNVAAERMGFSSELIPQLVREFRAHTPQITLVAEVRALLAELRAEYALGCVSDGHTAVQRGKLAALGIEPLLDAIVVSDELGRECWKPDPRPFWECCRRLNANPQQCVFVGDNPPRDVRGARAAGLISVWLRRPEGYYSRVQTAPADKPHFEIHSLAEIPGLLHQIESEPAHA